MEMSAYATVKDRLSPQGVETLGMVDAAVQELGVEAFDLAENVKALPADEIRTIEIYVARISLIEHARKELYEPGE
jgi:hypothetical protein